MTDFIQHNPKAQRDDTRPLSEKWSWQDWALLLLVITLAAWVRLTHIDSSLSFDELWHLGLSTGLGDSMTYFEPDVVHHDANSLTSLEHANGIVSVWTGMDGVLHPPLYVVLLRLWRELVGAGDFSAHGFSIVWGVVAVAFVFASARQAMNRIAATTVGLALAFAQTQVYFSQEVRAYALLTALASMALCLMTRIECAGPTKRRAILLAAVTLPLMLTHYFAAGACLAIAVYGLIALRSFRKTFILTLTTSAALYAIIWLPFAIGQLDDLGTGDAFLRFDKGPLHLFLLAGGIPFRLLAERDYEMEMTPIVSCVLFILPWMLIRRWRPLLPWVLWLCLSILPILMLDLARSTVHTQYIRYAAVASPAVPLLFVGIAWGVGRKALAYAFGCVISFVGGIYLFSGNVVLLDADNFSDATRVLEPKMKPGDAIVTYSGRAPAFYRNALALTLSHSDRLFPCTLAVLTKPLTDAQVAELGTTSIWLVSGEPEMQANELVPGSRVEAQYVANRAVMVRHLVIDRDLAPADRPATPPATQEQRADQAD